MKSKISCVILKVDRHNTIIITRHYKLSESLFKITAKRIISLERDFLFNV